MSITERVQSQVGRRFKKPDLVGGIPYYDKGLELDDIKGPVQIKPFSKSLGDSAILILFSNCFPTSHEHQYPSSEGTQDFCSHSSRISQNLKLDASQRISPLGSTLIIFAFSEAIQNIMARW